ncbi:MAG: META domain-containing protein [Chloroflexi bacterium]|nr:META domain-containing protein [Chloroflexota bacterium]
MKTNKKKSYLANFLIPILLLLLALAACSKEEPTPTPVPPEPAVEVATAVPETTEPEATEPEAELPEISQPIYRWGEVADRLWVLVGYGDALNPTVVEEGIKITATFSSVEPTVSGSGGCNNYFTNYTSTDDGGLTINGPIGSTMMACETGAEQEIAYFGALETVTNWVLNDEGRLELTYSTGQPYEEKLVYAPGEVPLTGTTWRLVSFGNPGELTSVEEGTAVTVVFTPETDTSGAISGNATCNQYTTSYALDGNNISFGPTAGTMMMCPVGADQETAYLAALGSAQTYEIVGANMQITYDGGVLNYTARNLPLENVLWQAVMVAGQPVPEGVEITALLELGEAAGSGAIAGNAGCNNYNTGYTTDGSNLTINSPMAMTMMACPDEALAGLERSYLGSLETAESYEIFGDQLLIHSQNGDIQYAADRQPLEGPLWRLISLGNASDLQPPVEGSNFTALFNRLPTLPSGSVVGETGCNDYNATFTSNLSEIKINLPAKTNNEDCPWGNNFEVEQQFFLGLNSATSYRILGNVLQIPYGEGENTQVLNFVASQPPVDGEVLDLTPLQGTFWYLSAIGDNPIISGSEITADFDIDEGGTTGTISGSGGCNGYNAAIGENFAIGPIASTQKACDPAVIEQEGGYFDWLSKAYGFDRAGDQLLISTANGILTYNSAPILDQAHELQNVNWYLLSYETLEAVPGHNPTAFFAPDGSSLNGNTGCNEYTGAYKAEQGNLLTISGFSTTRAACTSDALATQEETFLRLMPAAVSYAVYGTSLQILTVDGGTMNFTSIPPQAPAGPTAVIISEDLAETGQPIFFDGSQSAAGSAPIVRYDWEMGDGALLSGASLSYAYNAPGTFTVKLTVTDQAGQNNSTTKPVQITPVVEVIPPTAVIEGPQMAFVGEQVTFSAANSQQGTAAITSYNWQSGDGNNTGDSSLSSFTTIYTQPGTYYPSVTVADAGGLSDSASMAIVINATLEGSSWLLNNTMPGSSITLNFGNGSLSGFAGCNSYNAGYTTTLAAGNTNSITVGPITATGAICTPELASQEQAYLATLQTASSYTINGATLTLTTASGPLTFSAAVATPYAAP